MWRKISSLASCHSCKVLNINGARMQCRTFLVHHVDGSLVIYLDDGRVSLRPTKLIQDGLKILDQFGTSHSSNEFSLCGTGGHGELETRLVGNRSTSKEDHKASNRALGLEISGMCCVHKCTKLLQWQGLERRQEGSASWTSWDISGRSDIG